MMLLSKYICTAHILKLLGIELNNITFYFNMLNLLEQLLVQTNCKVSTYWRRVFT